MKATFIELPAFERYRKHHMTDEDYQVLQRLLLSDFNKGDRIQGTGGLRKLRFSTSGKGKRGGGRVIYYWQDERGICWLFAAYEKNQQTDLTNEQRETLKTLLAQLKELS